MKKENIFLSVIIGLFLGFCFHIRSIALVLFVSVILFRVITLIKEKNMNLSAFRFSLFTIASFYIVFMAIKFIWPADSNYPDLFITENIFPTAINHLSYQNEEFHRFFRNYEIKDYFIILCIAASSLTCFTWLGFFHQLKYNRFSFLNIYAALYIVALMVYTASDSGIRFLLPLVFILFYYAIIGLKNAVKPVSPNTFWLPYIFGFFILFSYHESWKQMPDRQKDVLEGPETTTAQELFSYVKKNIAKDQVIVFDKPRALSLYTGHEGVCFKPENTKEELILQLKKFNVSYWITHSLLTSETNKALAQDSTLKLQLVFDNGATKVYKNTKL